jgi:hypothetical protein
VAALAGHGSPGGLAPPTAFRRRLDSAPLDRSLLVLLRST